MPKIELTRSQINNLIDFFDYEFISYILSVRKSTAPDNISCLVDMCDIYKKLKEAEVVDNAE